MSKLVYMLLHPDANFAKLKTREDPQHIHKTLGFLAVCSFVYRYGYVYPRTGNLGFGEGTLLDWATMAVHTVLAFSSILFRVPIKRIETKPMVIYEEYRQHAMVFTLRCFSVFTVATLWSDATSAATLEKAAANPQSVGLGALGSDRPAWVVPVVVALHHLMADYVTHKHGSGSTAVRATSEKLKVSYFYSKVGLLYSFYQFAAIASHICPSAHLPDLAYNAIIAIQSSAFMMTLYRKRIIRGRTHMVVYSGCLLLSAFHIARVIGYRRLLLAALAFAVRINLPRAYSNKYVIWTGFLLLPYGLTQLLEPTNALAPMLAPAAPVLNFFADGAYAY